MDKDKYITQHQESIRNAEKEISDLAAQKKKLEEQRQSLFEWKRKDMAYLSQLHSDLQGEVAQQDRRMIENLLDGTQQMCRSVEQQMEQEAMEIERKHKQVSAQKEFAQAEYRRAQHNVDKGGTI